MKIEWRSCFRICASVFLLYLAISFWPGFVNFLGILIGGAAPLLLGCVVAYLINILMSFYERHYFVKSAKASVVKSRRPVCMIAAFLSLVGIVCLIVGLIVPELVSCVQLLLAEVPDVIKSCVSWLDSHEILTDEVVASLQNINWKEKIEQSVNMLISGVGNVMGSAISVVSSVVSGVVTFFLGCIFAIYLLTGKEKLGCQFNKLMRRYLKPSCCDRIKHTLSVVNDSFHRYIVGQCTEALILGGLCAIGMMILGMPYATMIGALIAFTALIPVAGAYIGAGVGAFMILTVSPMKAILFLVFIVVLQQVEGNLIYPKVVGSSLGLPAIWVLTAVTLGGSLMGIMGMVLAVPLAAAAYRLLRENVNKEPAKGESV